MLVFGLGLIGGGIGVLVCFRDELRVFPPVRRWILPALRRWVIRPVRVGAVPWLQSWAVPWLQGWILPWLPLGGPTGRSRPGAVASRTRARPTPTRPGASTGPSPSPGPGPSPGLGPRLASRAVGRASLPAETEIRPPGGRPPPNPRITGRASPPPASLLRGGRQQPPAGLGPLPHRTDHTE